MSPAQWKGSRSKKVDQPFILGLLKPLERAALEQCGVPRSLRHNVIDAMGIVLRAIGRR